MVPIGEVKKTWINCVSIPNIPHFFPSHLRFLSVQSFPVTLFTSCVPVEEDQAIRDQSPVALVLVFLSSLSSQSRRHIVINPLY